METAWECEGRRTDLERFRPSLPRRRIHSLDVCFLMHFQEPWSNVPLVKRFWLRNAHSNRSKSCRNSGNPSGDLILSLLVLCDYSTIVWHLWKEWSLTSWAYRRRTWGCHPRYCPWERRPRPSENPQDNCGRREVPARSATTMLFPWLQNFSSKTSFLALSPKSEGK